jgi:CubicO group peptidase (beta-lactamase class C family)
VLIARGGHVAFAEAFGWRDREAKAPMELDAIFRIASVTKLLTSVAAMIPLLLYSQPKRPRLQTSAQP